MENATRDYLRKAAASALSDKDDASALEIIKFLQASQGQQVHKQSELMLLPQQTPAEGPARDCHYWAQFVRERFIPFIEENGRFKFTSSEVFTWLENHCKAMFTTGDLMQLPSGGYAWRSIASNGLCNLKKQGVIEGEPHSKTYIIKQRLLAQQIRAIPVDDPDRLDAIKDEMPVLP